MKIARIVAVFAALAAVVGWIAVSAGTLPNISGTWYAYGNAGKRCNIDQSGTSVSLRNEDGVNASGSFTDPSTLSTNWGRFGGSITGRISGDLNTITWSNGTYWTRFPGGAPAPTPTPGPHSLPFEQVTNPGAPSPIRIIGAWAAQTYDGNAGFACFHFENTSSETATLVRFEFALLGKNGAAIETWHLDRKGTFSPNVEIHGSHNITEYQALGGPRGYRDNCTSWKAQTPRERKAYPRARSATYRIESVEFASP